MIPLDRVTVLHDPQDVFAFRPTSTITELRFEPNNLHIDHTQDTRWTSVLIGDNPPAEQQATLWIFAVLGGRWTAAGMERLRPTQRDKPEGPDPRGFIAGFVEGRDFGAFNGYRFLDGDPIGFMVVQGSTRLDNQTPMRERSLVIEMQYPCTNGRIQWEEGQSAEPAPAPQPEPEPTPVPLPAPAPSLDVAMILNRLAGIDSRLALVQDAQAQAATKQDIIDLRGDVANGLRQLTALVPFLKRFFPS